MPLPERMKPARVTRKQMKELISQLNGILDHIDNGMDENNEELKQMMADWNAKVVMPCGFSDFRDFSSWTSALDFTRMALNQEKYLDDFTWTELNDVINFIRKAEGSESDHSYALQLLEVNFKANPLDLIYHPDCWFNDEALFHARLTTEEIGGYLMKKSGRWLNDAPDIQLVYAIPLDVYD
ncbi:hypothetical protein [Klebsiella michiganensis]|uniref:hypothetical protein n=1 Tax=Klebsiella michiganensis TaxID=1134687 RepID=UPI0025A075F2|nr:hypothetical protein [Klebsiella michiganensis]MDM6955186.1 hypothetical protein [Klebsiella michiganensis]